MAPPKPPVKRRSRAVLTPGAAASASTSAPTPSASATPTPAPNTPVLLPVPPPPLTPLTVTVPAPTAEVSVSPLSSPALSIASSSSSSTPTPTKRKQPKSGVTNEEAYEKLCTGEYVLQEPYKNWTCPAWKSFKLVVDPASQRQVGVAQCQRCLKCLAYSSDAGPSSLAKHLRGACRVPDAGAKATVIVPKRMRDNLALKLAEKCARDLSSINGAVGEGMASVVQAALDIGSACPGAQAADIMPCFNTVRRKLTDEADECRGLVVARMREAIADGRCAATSDMWTDEFKDYHYLAVTAHFTNEKWEQESWDLCTPKFPCSQRTTGENILNALISELTGLGITDDEFWKIEWVTDQGANMVKALEKSNRIDCAAHCLNTVLKTSLTLSYVELRKKVLSENVDTEEILEKFSEVASVVKKARETGAKKVGGDVNLNKLQEQVTLPQKASFMYDAMLSSVLLHQKQVVRVLHFLNRADLATYITDDAVHSKALDIHACLKPLEKSGSVSGAALETLTKHLEKKANDSPLLASMKERLAEERELLPIFIQVKKCKEVVKFLKTAAYSSQLSQMVKQECDTRWNSLCSMLDSLLKVFDEVRLLLTANGEQKRLNGIVLEDMQWLLQFLLPFREETDTLQGQKYPTLPFVLLASCRLREHTDPQLLDNEPQAILRARVSAALDRKLQPSMAHKIATFLWPQYRHLRMLTDAERDEVYSEVRNIIHVEPDHDLTPSSPKKPRLDDKYNKWCTPDVGAAGASGSGGETLDEVDRYLLAAPSVPAENLLMHWKSQFDLKDLGGLAKLAHRALGKPATSAPSERVFSAAGYLIQERRTRLAPDLVDKTIFLHSYLQNKYAVVRSATPGQGVGDT